MSDIQPIFLLSLGMNLCVVPSVFKNSMNEEEMVEMLCELNRFTCYQQDVATKYVH